MENTQENLDDLNVQNHEEGQLRGALLMKGVTRSTEGDGEEGTGNEELVQTSDADPEPTPAEHDPPVPVRSTNGPVSIISDKLGQDHPIHAKQLETQHTVTLTGDITGTSNWNFAGAETLATDISADAVTNRELAANSVYGSAGGDSQSSVNHNIVPNTISKADLNTSVYTGTVTSGSEALVTSGAVYSAIADATLNRGTDYGPMTVTQINALADIHTGSTVHVTGQGTTASWDIADGVTYAADGTPAYGSITVTKGEDLRYVVNGSNHGWYSLEANVKLRQTAVADPTVPSSGTTESISFIDTLSQNENGNITPTKKNVRQASTSVTGVVQLSNSITSTSETMAATPKAVSDVKAIADGKLSPVSAVTDPTVEGTGIDFVDSVTQATTGQITVHRKTVQSATQSQAGLMSSADKGKLDGLKTGSEYQTALNGKKNVQTAITTDPAADGTGLTFVDSVKQNAQGVIEVHRKTVQSATQSQAGLMSSADKGKLDGISTGANKVEASATNGKIKIDGTDTTVYTHPTGGANKSAGDTTDQTPGFGGTFKALSATVDAAGHTTALAAHTVTIPSAVAVASTSGVGGSAGLMSAADKEKLTGIAAGAEVNQNAFSNVTVGDVTVAAGSKTDTFEIVQGSGVTLTADAAAKTITISTASSPASAAPQDVTSGTAAVGTSGSFARADHVHHIDVATGTETGTVRIAGANAKVKDWDNKADKVSMQSGHADNFASLDENGNLQDSGHKHSDYKTKQEQKSSPSASGNAIAFIDTVSQNTNGEITATKKTITSATTATAGIVTLAGSIGATVATENNKAASEKAVRDAINALDYPEAGEAGKYIQAIGESNGVIAPVVETADTAPTANSQKLITSGGVQAAIAGLNKSDSAVSTKFVTAVSESAGVITVTRAQPVINDVSGLSDALAGKQPNLAFDGTYDASDNKVATVSSITSRINGLDSNPTSVDGTNVQVKVTQTDGKITAVNITTDNTENKANKKTTLDSTSNTDYPTSKAVATYVSQQIATQSATFRGTLSLTQLGLQYGATDAEIAAALNSYTWPAGVTITNNDTVNVTVNNPATQDVDVYKRFKYSTSESTWKWEYDINNTTFTTAQMNAINSGITEEKRVGYDSHVSSTSNPHNVTKSQVGLGNVVDTGDSDTPVSGGTTKFTTGGAYTELNKKADKTATVSSVDWDSDGKKITKTINGTTTDVVSAATLKSAMALENVDNTSDATKKSAFTGSIADGNTGFVTGDAVYDALALKQNKLATQTVYTNKGNATTVPQITTNSLGQVTGITEVTISGVTPAAHSHGYITDDGAITASSQSSDKDIQGGDKIVIVDANDSNKVSRAAIEFDGDTTTLALTPKGTWEHFEKTPTDISGKADWADTVTGVILDDNSQSIQEVKGQPGGTTVTTTVVEFDGTYDSSTNKIATQSTVSTAIAALDETKSGSSSHVSVTVSEVDGKLSSVTVSDTAAASNHTHGDITNDGKITASAVAAASGDALVIVDSSESGKVVKSTVAFNGSATQALTGAGTWADFNNNPAFSKVKVGSTNIEADSTADTLELVAGSGVALTPDATNDKVTIAHSHTVAAGTIGSSTDSSGITLAVPYATYDANGHIDTAGTHTHTIPDGTTEAKGVVQLQDSVGATETADDKAATPKSVRDAINELDAASVGGVGTDQYGNPKVEYISSISETDGVITAVTATMDNVPTADSTNAVTSSGIKAALDQKVDVDDMLEFSGRGTYDAANHRLTFNDIIFDSIYPVVGKYGLAVFSETTAVQSAESAGDKEWLLDWRPYLIDMTAVEGEVAKTPVAELKQGNWFRKTDGSYAPVCCVTTAQLHALDGKSNVLKVGPVETYQTSSNELLVSDYFPDSFDNNGNFLISDFWGSLSTYYWNSTSNDIYDKLGIRYNYPIEIEFSDGTNTYRYGGYKADGTDHIPAPWETDETKYSVFIGRQTDVYVIDGVYAGDSTDSSNNRLYMRGLAAKPVPVGVDGFDPEFFKLRRTGISPGPSTVVSSKIRNCFYNYVVASSDGATVRGNAGSIGVCYDNGTYPATGNVSQYKAVQWSRGCNYTGSNGAAIPVAEGGYHSLNAFLCSIEAAYKTRNVFGSPNAFSSGNTSNDACTNAAQYRTNGGLRLDIDANTSYYYQFANNMKNTESKPSGISSDAYVFNVVNNQYAHFQCMEPQIAASIAAELKIAPNADFVWNGGTWHYEVPSFTGIKTLADNRMNCRIYKDIAFENKTIGGKTGCNGHVNLRCALAEGVNPVGDINWYMGGGCEFVYLNSIDDGFFAFYLEPEQSKWISGSYVTSAGTNYANEKIADSTSFATETKVFAAEKTYTCLIDMNDTDNPGGGGTGQCFVNGYCLSRTGYTPVRKLSGGSNQTGECCYQYRQEDDDSTNVYGMRTRRRVSFGGHASSSNCSPRYLLANYRPSRVNANLGCAAQVILA